MKDETRQILNASELIAARQKHIERLERVYAGEAAEPPFVLNGILAAAEADPYTEPERWVDECLDFLAEHADALPDNQVFSPLVVEFGPYGVHFIDKIFGAHVYESDGNWWNDPLETPIGELVAPNLEADETWQPAQRAATAFVAAGLRSPFFGLPTLSSALNIAINLYGEAFLAAMLAEPDAARRDLRTINDLLCELHQWYRDTIPAEQLQPVVAAWRTQPAGYGQLCGCSNQLLSPDQYAEFIAPLDDALLSVYPNGGMMHLCGAHTQHIPTWRQMRSLRAVQLNDRAADDFATYYRELRDDQVIYLNPTSTMTAKDALDIAAGRRLVLVGEGE